MGLAKSMKHLTDISKNAELYSMLYWKPMQVAEKWSGMVVLPFPSNQLCFCILHFLNLGDQIFGNTMENSYVVVNS